MKKMSINNAMNAAQQSQINISFVFNYLNLIGSANRSRIAEELGLSIPAVSRAVEILEESRRIIKQNEGTGDARKGTPVYRINSKYGYVLAVDLIKKISEAVITDYSGKVITLVKGFQPEKSDQSGDIITDLFILIKQCIEEFISSTSETYQNIKAIVVGVPAVINKETGKLMISYYDSIKDIQLRNVLEKNYKIPVFIENICSLSVLAEKNYGDFTHKESMVFVEIGNGIGAGILLDGNLYRGNGFAGEMGFSLTERNSAISLGRKKGYLEKNASLSALKHNIQYELSCGVDSTLSSIYTADQTSITPEIIFLHAADGDIVCCNAISDMVYHIATALHNMIIILNPEVIVFGGDICFLPEIDILFTKPIKDKLKETLPFPIPEIAISSLGSEAGILGATAFAIETLLLKDFPYHQSSF